MPEGPWAFGASPRICPATLVCALQWAVCQSPTKRLASYFEESTKPGRPKFGPRSFPHPSNFGEHDLFSTLAMGERRSRRRGKSHSYVRSSRSEPPLVEVKAGW